MKHLYPKKASLLTKAFTTLTLISFFSIGTHAQTYNIPQTGFDTVNACVGLFRDPGGSSNYPGYSNGALVIDPPGNTTVNVQFTSFNTFNSSDYIRIYDGVGTTGNVLGTYWGSNLPNNGVAISSTSGAVTLYFYSNCCSHTSGFEGNFTTNASAAPNASFVPASTTPAYNVPVQFINTTTNGATYLWDFGDGQSSTEINPSHRYTVSGPKQVKLIATNCFGSDTSNVVNLTVQAAPLGSLSTDTVKMSIPCGTSNSTSFTISNAGSGNLNYGLSLSTNSNMLAYSEDFENGAGDFTDLYNNQTLSFPTTGAAEGAQYLRLDGSGFNPIVANINSLQPENISYYVKSDSYTSYHGQFGLGSGNWNTHQVLFYSVFRYNDLRLYYRYIPGNYITYYSFPQTSGQWHHIELRNIDWTARTFDLYVDNTLLVTGAGMQNNTISDVNFMYLANSNFSTSGLDGIRFNGVNASSIFTFSPNNGNLSNGSNNVIFINADASGLNAGVYDFDFTISSNDTALDGKVLPLQLTVTGTADLVTDKNCSNLGAVFTAITYPDSVMMTNTGCDTLDFSSITATSSDISLSANTLGVAPGDTFYYTFDFTPTSIGSFSDTLFFQGTDTNYAYCLTANASGAPSVFLDTNHYVVHHTGCNDSASFTIVIGNRGLDSLRWGASGTYASNRSDDFESGTYNTALWQQFGTGITVTNGTSCGSLNNYHALFNGSFGRSMETVPLNLSAGGTINFNMRRTIGCNTPESNEGIYLEYSTNGGSTWNNIAYYYFSSTNINQISVAIPVAAQTSSTLIRFIQPYHNSGLDVWLLDDIRIAASIVSANLSFAPDTGAIAVSAYDTVTAYIDVSGLTTGTYNFGGAIATNDPQNPVYPFSVTLNLTGLPGLKVPNACIDMDTVVAGVSLADSVLIYNAGCGDVNFTSISNTNPIFTLSNAPATLAAGDSLYLQYIFAPLTGPFTFNDTIRFVSNDSTKEICVQAYVQGAPVAGMDSSAINVSINSCDDSVNVQRYLYNTGMAGLNFQVVGNDGFMPLQEVLDTFKTTYTNLTSLIVNRYNFGEGIFSNNIGDGGGDMYDGGNYISTDPLANFSGVPYSNDLVVSSADFGTNGQYFTYKGTGIFLFAADLDNTDAFRINGNLGADGRGTVDVSTITSTLDGITYTGYIKRVYNAGDPSVNHLIITEQNSNITRTYSTSTDDDAHTLTGLTGNKRMYYILFAGGGVGTYQPNNVFQGIMDSFLATLATNALPSWVSVSPDSGTVAVNDSTLLDIWIKSKGLVSGTHAGTISVKSNDPANPTIRIPISLTVTGAAKANLLTNACLTYSNVQQGVVSSDSAFLTNTGCDTLNITSASGNLSVFSAVGLPLSVAPGDTVPLIIDFSSTAVGTFTDTLVFSNNDSAFAVCLNATTVGAPFLHLPQDTIHYELNKCKIVGNETFRIENQGLGGMNYSLSIGGYRGTSLQTYNTASAITNHSFTGIPAATSTDTLEVRIVLNGDYDDYWERTYMTIDGSWNYGYLPDANLNYVHDTMYLTFWGNNVVNWTADGALSFSLSNSFEVDGGVGSFHEVSIRLTSQVNWVSVVGATSGTVAANSGVNKSLLFNAALLPVGTYHTNLNINNNSPGNPEVVVPIVFDVVAEADIQTTDTCLNFPLTLIGDTATATFSVFNDGCDVLSINNVTSTNSSFTVNPSGSISSVAIGDSVHYTVQFIPTLVGNFSASLLISNSDEPLNICLNATSGAQPVAAFNASPENNCLGEFSFTDQSQYNPTSYYWQFGDGNTSNLANPIHQYLKPGNYTVTLRVNNTYGFDTLSTSVTADPFYVHFTSSVDTVELDSLVNFYDSSLTANGWSWTFGDGNGAIVQNPTHSYSAQGQYTVTLDATDSRNCQASFTKTIYVINSIGIEENALEQALHVFPNPTKGWLQVEVLDKTVMRHSMILYNNTGQEAFRILSGAHNKVQIDLNQLSSGLYFLHLYDEQGHLKGKKKVVINR